MPDRDVSAAHFGAFPIAPQPVGRSALARYTVAIAATSFAAGVRFLLNDLYDTHTAFLLFTAAVMVSAWYGGLGPGILTTLAGGVLGWLFLVSPAVSPTSLPEICRLLVYLCIGLVISGLTDALHSARTELELRTEVSQSNERAYRRLLDTAAEGIWTLDPEARILYANEQLARMLGCRSDELLGRSAMAFVFTEDRAASGRFIHPGREQAPREPTNPSELRLRCADDTPLWVIACVNPVLSERGEYLGSLGMFTDISERRRLQQELLERNWALELADRNKDHFLAVLGHELRNPLGPILHAAEILDQSEVPDARQRRAVLTIKREVQQQSRLIDDLLDVARIARGQILLRLETVSLTALVHSVAEDRRSWLEHRKLKLRLDIPEMPLWVRGDPTRLAQIVGNLLQNAARYTDAGGEVTVSVEPDAHGGFVTLRLRDTGIGIEAEMLPHIFDAFSQERRNGGRGGEGLGLGLALVRGLVELHRGTITAASDGVGQGAELTIRLPLGEGPPSPGDATLAGSAAPLARRVLVIDDNAAAAETMRDLLELHGHAVETASDGIEGLERTLVFRPEVVLCDLNLPGMSGCQFASTIRPDPAYAGVRLVAVSGYGRQEDIQRALAAGFERYLVKPVDVAELIDLLNEP